MDRQLFKRPFKKTDDVIFPCPACGNHSLKLDETKFHSEDTAESKKMQESDYWEPEWLASVFTTVFSCNNSHCKETVICSGTGYVDWEPEENEHGEFEQEYYCFHTPKIFIPAMHFFKIPDKCPDSVKNSLLEAFSLTLHSPSSAANKVRAAVENLLTEFGIPRITRKPGKNIRLPLDARIAKAKNHKAILGELENILYALKWLGNAGSHANSEISVDDVFDAYEFMNHILSEIYEPKQKLEKLAKEIRKQKGPVKAKRSI